MIVKLLANHKRALSTTLVMLDELLMDIQRWVDGQCHNSVLYKENNDLTERQKKKLQQQIEIIQTKLLQIGIEVNIQSAVNDIWSRVSAFRENIMELESRHMKRYGQIPQESQNYLNDLSKELLFQLDRILEIIKN